MKTIKLTQNETNYYETVILPRVKQLPQGIQFKPAVLFDPDPTNARLCRKLREDVASGKVTRIAALGTRSSEGYRVV